MDHENLIRQLKETREQQIQNQQLLRKHDQLEQDVHELNVRSRRLFSEINDTWQKDSTLAPVIDNNRNELLYHERQIDFKLDHTKEELLKKKRQLFDLEDILYSEQYSQMRKEDKE